MNFKDLPFFVEVISYFHSGMPTLLFNYSNYSILKLRAAFNLKQYRF